MKIVILEPLGIFEEQLNHLTSILEQQGNEIVTYKDRVEDTEILIQRSAGADVLVITNLPLNGEVIRSLPNLKMISVAFTGIDHVDASACKHKGITVCNTPGYSTHSVGELVFGLIISILRKIVPCDSVTRKGLTRAGLIGNELYGKTVGIVGTGSIGIRVAEIARAFGCEVLAYSRTQKEEAKTLGVNYVSIEELLSKSDIITLHAPLTAETKLLINKERIALMKSTSILINAARGPLVDSEALAIALNEGRIAGAGIDVFEMEPPIAKTHPLLNAKNVVVAPHIAFATVEAMNRRAEIAFNNIAEWMSGKPQNIML